MIASLRFALNYKGLKYRTEWVEYPDIETLCKKIGAGPTAVKDDGITPHYTFPVIYDPSTKTVVADSTSIADYLDKTYPDSPPLYPRGTRGLHAAFDAVFWTAGFWALFRIVVVAQCFGLPERSYEYFRRTREVAYGRLEDIAPEGEKREKEWKEVEAGMSKIASWMKANGDKPFLGGDVPIYADMQIAARLIWARVVMGKDSKDWKRFQALDGGMWDRLLQQFEKWSAVM